MQKQAFKFPGSMRDNGGRGVTELRKVHVVSPQFGVIG